MVKVLIPSHIQPGQGRQQGDHAGGREGAELVALNPLVGGDDGAPVVVGEVGGHLSDFPFRFDFKI